MLIVFVDDHIVEQLLESDALLLLRGDCPIFQYSVHSYVAIHET